MASWLKSLLGLAPAFEVGDLVETRNLKNRAYNDVTGRVVGFRQDGRINVELISFKKGQVLGLKAEKLIKIGRESDNEEESDTEDEVKAEVPAKIKAKQQQSTKKAATNVNKSKKQLAKEKAQQARIEKQKKLAKEKAQLEQQKADAAAAAARHAKEEEERAAREAQEKEEAARRKKEQEAEQARAAAAAKAEAEAAAKEAKKRKKATSKPQKKKAQKKQAAQQPTSKPQKQKAAPAPSKKPSSKKHHKKSKKHAPTPAPSRAPVAAPAAAVAKARAADAARVGEWSGDATQRLFFVFVVPSVVALILAFILFSAGDPEVNDAKIGYIKSRQLHFAFMGVLVFSLLKRFENALPLITNGVSEGETLVQGLKNSAFSGDAVALNLLLASSVFPFPAFCAMVLVALGRARRKVCGEHGQGSAEALAVGSMLLEGMIMVVIVRCLAVEN